MGKTLSDMELDFFEEFDNESQEAIEWRSDDEGEGEMNSADNKAFWELQHQLLQVIFLLYPSFLNLISIYIIMLLIDFFNFLNFFFFF